MRHRHKKMEWWTRCRDFTKRFLEEKKRTNKRRKG